MRRQVFWGRLAPLGRLFFAIAMVAFGIQHVVYGDFVTRVVPTWPAWIAPRPLWASVVGAVLVGAGIAIAAGKRVPPVATLLGSLMLLSFVLLALPLAASDAPLGGLWTVAGKVLALSGGAFLVARSTSTNTDAAAGGLPGVTSRLTALWPLAPSFFGAFLALCGIQHFIHVEFVRSLVPSWIPGALFWTYFTGVALIAAGLGVVLRPTAWLAGILSGLMIFIWVIVLHIPRAAAAPPGATNEMTAVFEALAMSGIALLVSATAREAPLAES